MPDSLIQTAGQGGIVLLTIVVIVGLVAWLWVKIGKPATDTLLQISKNFADASANHREAARESNRAAEVNRKAAELNTALATQLEREIDRLGKMHACERSN